MRCVILRPPYIWGKGNKGIENVIAKVKSGRFRWINNGRATIETVEMGLREIRESTRTNERKEPA